MGNAVWKVLSAGAAMGAGLLADRMLHAAWKSAGKEVPEDPANPEKNTFVEAVAFAALSGLLVNAARVAAQRKAAQYYAHSAGHLPAALTDGEDAEQDTRHKKASR